jgi:hypothetical protein
MSAMAFDTHEAANRFKAAGFTDDQVEAQVDVTRRTTSLPDVSSLASRADLAELRSDLKAEMGELRSELKAEIAGVKTIIASTQVQTITVILTAVAAMLVLSRLIPGSIH